MCPKGVCPRSWPRAMASVRSSFSLQAAGQRPGHLRHFQRVGQPGAVVVAHRGEKDLRFIFQPPEALAMNDPIPIPLKIRPHVVGRDGGGPPGRIRRAFGIRRKPCSFFLFQPLPYRHNRPSRLSCGKKLIPILNIRETQPSSCLWRKGNRKKASLPPDWKCDILFVNFCTKGEKPNEKRAETDEAVQSNRLFSRKRADLAGASCASKAKAPEKESASSCIDRLPAPWCLWCAPFH